MILGDESRDQTHPERFRDQHFKMVATLSLTTGIGLKVVPRAGYVKQFS